MSGKINKKGPVFKSHNCPLPIPASTCESILSISFNDEKMVALPINYGLTLDKLRHAIKERNYQLEKNDFFVTIDGFSIDSLDEQKICIREIVNVNNSNMVTIRRNTKSSTISSFQRESSSLSYELTVTTTSFPFSQDHQNNISISQELSSTQWKQIYFNNNLLRGRSFLANGPKVADYQVIKLKPNWKPNGYPCDNTTMQIETFYQQTNDEFAAYKMYKIDTIAKLPFVHLTFGNDSDKYRLLRTNTDNSLTFFHHVIHRFVHLFDPTMIELDSKFIDEIDLIFKKSSNENKYEELSHLFDKYGHGYAAKVVLGGEKARTERQQNDELYNEHECQQRGKAKLEVAYNDSGLGVNFEGNKKQTNIHQTLNNNSVEIEATMGGDALKADMNEWCEALNNFQTWRIIDYLQIEPLYKLLDPERQQKIKAIIDEYQLEQQRQRQQLIRCKNIPTELVFYESEGVFKLKIPHEMFRRLSLYKSTKVLLFFYSPSCDEWYLKPKEQEKDIWISLKHININNIKSDLAINIIQTLRTTNPIPNNQIIKICQFYDNIYIAALTRLGKTINDLIYKNA